jgi:rhodanese-related sulfurtransferase
MKNKTQLIPLLALIVLLLAGCGGTATPEAAAPSATAADVDLSALPVNIDVAEAYALSSNPDVYMIDVREQDEYDSGHIPDIHLLPMSTLEDNLDQIPTDKTVVVTCHTGNRSNQVTQYLRANGYNNVHNMNGGISEWEAAGYPVEN